MKLNDDTLISDIFCTFMIRYDRLKEDIILIYKDFYIKNLKEYNKYGITQFFTQILIDSVKSVNKIVISIFIKNHSKEIINIIILYSFRETNKSNAKY